MRALCTHGAASQGGTFPAPPARLGEARGLGAQPWVLADKCSPGRGVSCVDHWVCQGGGCQPRGATSSTRARRAPTRMRSTRSTASPASTGHSCSCSCWWPSLPAPRSSSSPSATGTPPDTGPSWGRRSSRSPCLCSSTLWCTLSASTGGGSGFPRCSSGPAL